MLWPKILGGWNLHRATAQRDLHLFVLFSSSVGVLGRAGQSNHAAANAFLERLAAHRRASGLPAQVIHWGAWSEIGEAEEQRERIAAHLMTTGVHWMTPRQGIAALDRVVAEGRASTVVTAVDWATYTDRLEGEQPFFADMVPSRKPELTAPQVQESPADVLRHLETGESQGRKPTLVGFLQQELQALLRLPAPPDPEATFADLGVDSLMAVEFRNRINRAFGDRYQASSTIVFDHPDVRTMARFLAQELGSEAALVAEPVQKPSVTPETTVPVPPADQDATVAVAVVGMACRFPDADGLEEFWTLLETGTSAVKECRPVAGEGAPPGYATPFNGAFVRDLDRFDAAFFRTVPIEARTLDPQQRMLLEVGWHALEDAGVAPETLEGVTTGIYVGISNTEYRELMSAAGIPIDYPGTSGSFAAARLAQALRTQGPAVPIDMDCASALVAVDQAVRALHAGDVNLALAAGVNVVLSERATNSMVELQMLSPTGKCAPFAAAADGFVRGEGCGVLVLKRLADAEADGDRIWGVIRGSSVNQNTGSAGMMLPSERTLEQLLADALDMAGWEPGDVDYLEAHAVGSTVGDAVEVQAAANVYGRGRLPSRPLLLGTVKHAIGHLETASGIAGLIKVLLAMQAGRIPSAGHVERLNTNVPWHRLPVRIAEETPPWPEQQDGMHRAAVNAFGVAGANAHVLVESPAGSSRGVRDRVPAAHTGTFPATAVRVPVWRMLPLSARSQSTLQHVIQGYLDWLVELEFKPSSGSDPDEERLADLAWTATVARSHHPWRVGVPFRDLASLRDGLRSALRQPVANPCRARQRIAMVFATDNSPWHQELDDLALMGSAAAVVIDRCAEILRQEFGGVLSDCDESGAATWPATVMFAAYSAMVAQWAAVDIQPGVCLAGPGGIPLALHAAGALDLEGGMRLAASQDRGGPDASHVARVQLPAGPGESSPIFDLVAGAEMHFGRFPAPDRSAADSTPAQATAACAALLVRESVDALVVFGLDDDFIQAIQTDWQLAARKAALGGTGRDGLAVVHTRSLAARDAIGSTARGGFAASAAAAYAQGLPLSMHKLFDGESRRRVGIPLYPFAGRGYWLQRSSV